MGTIGNILFSLLERLVVLGPGRLLPSPSPPVTAKRRASHGDGRRRRRGIVRNGSGSWRKKKTQNKTKQYMTTLDKSINYNATTARWVLLGRFCLAYSNDSSFWVWEGRCHRLRRCCKWRNGDHLDQSKWSKCPEWTKQKMDTILSISSISIYPFHLFSFINFK